MKLKILAILALSISLLALSSIAGATLISQDLSARGDGLVTNDPETGLSWLDLTATVGRTYNDVIGGYGGFTTTQGFRYATGAEVGQLLLDAGVTQGNIWGYWDFSNPYFRATSELVSLFGITYQDGLWTGSWGVLADDNAGVFMTNTHADSLVYQEGFPVNYPNAGSFLVRDTNRVAPVPEPSTMYLLAMGGLGMISLRRSAKKI